MSKKIRYFTISYMYTMDGNGFGYALNSIKREGFFNCKEVITIFAKDKGIKPSSIVIMNYNELTKEDFEVFNE